MVKAFKIRIFGAVQGVGFRYFIKKKGDKLGLVGWVRNLPDGTVEIFVQGADSILDEFIDSCRQSSDIFDIEKIEQEAMDIDTSLEEFIIDYENRHW